MRENLLRKEAKNLKDEVQTHKKIQWKAEEKMTCKKFDKLMKNTRTMVHNTSATDHITKEHRIVIHLSVRFTTQKEKQWLENESYLFSEFLWRVEAIESQLQEEYNQYRSNLYLKWHVSVSSDKYVKLIMSEKPQWFKNLWRRVSETVKTKNCKLSW